MLAVNGFDVLGIERDKRRFNGATSVRNAILQQWPEVSEHYRLVQGSYPDALAGIDWPKRETVLIFTNVSANWPREFEDKVISTFIRFNAVLFFARVFGHVRETAEEQSELLSRVTSIVPGQLTPLGLDTLNAPRIFVPEAPDPIVREESGSSCAGSGSVGA
jgi:hypothetical protein